MSSTSNIAEFIETQTRNGVNLWLEQGSLRFKAPQSSLTPALLATLKSRKQEIMQWLELQAAADPESKTDAAEEIETRFALSSSQSAIWMLQKFSPRSAVYNTSMILQLKAAPEPAVMKRFLQLMMARHAMLRTTFHESEEGAEQRVHKQLPPNFETVDSVSWSVATLDAWLKSEADAGFDLDRESLLRIKLLPESPKGILLIATVHHLIADLWSLLVIAQNLKTLMQQYHRGEVLLLPTDGGRYQDHVAQQKRWLKSAEAKVAWKYWRQQLDGAPCVTELPTDFSRPLFMRFEPHKLACVMTAAESDGVRSFCRLHGITPFVFFQSVLQLFVHAHTGKCDFLLGTPTVGRNSPGTESVVGDFANPVVLRARIELNTSIADWLFQVRESVLEALSHDAMPFPELVQRFNPPRDASRAPLFQIMFLWHQAQIDVGDTADWQANMLPESGPRGTPYDLMLSVSDLKTNFEIHWMVPQSLYRAERLEEFSKVFKSLIYELQVEDSRLLAKVIEKVRINNLISGVTLEGGEDMPVDPVTGFYPAGWGFWKNRPQNLLQLLKQQISAFSGDVILLARAKDIRSSFNCVYVVAADNQVVHNLEKCDFVDYVVNLPAFPFMKDGSLDLMRLAEIPTTDAHEIARISPHITVVHQSQTEPNLQHASVCLPDQFASTLASTAEFRNADIDISGRPLAYQIGAPLPEHGLCVKSLLHALRDTAEKFPERGIRYLDNVGKTECHLSYSSLWIDSGRYSNALLRLGITAGDVIVLQVRERKRFHIVFWALMRLGAIPLTIANPQQWSEKDAVALKVRNVAQQYASCRILTDQSVMPIKAWVGDKVSVLAMPVVTNEQAELIPLQQNYDLAFLQMTSGSTGIPKAIQITHQGILHHIAAVQRFNHYQPSDVTLNWLPYDHVVPLLTTHIKDVVLGCEQLQLPTEAVLANPGLWIHVMSVWRVTHSWSPNFGYQLVADHWRNNVAGRAPSGERPDLSCVRFLMNAGEQVLSSTVNAFMQVCEPLGLARNAVQPAFGMAECCTCMTYQNGSDVRLAVNADFVGNNQVLQFTADGRHGFANLGGVVPGVEIRIADSLGVTLREGVIGRLQIRGHVVTPGYLQNEDANREAFVGDGWFNSGDLGFIWKGELFVTGREKEMIVVRGNNYYCYEIEHLSTVEGVRPSFVAAVGISTIVEEYAQLAIFYVEDGTRARIDIETEIITTIQQAYGLSPAFVLPMDELNFYKTTSGKIQRGQFKKNFEAGIYQQQATAFEVRHQRNMLSPRVYRREMSCESLTELIEDKKDEKYVYMTPISQWERVKQHPAFSEVVWNEIEGEASLNKWSNDPAINASLNDAYHYIIVLPSSYSAPHPCNDEGLKLIRDIARSPLMRCSTNKISLILLDADETLLMRFKSVVESLGREIGGGGVKLIGVAEGVNQHLQIVKEASSNTHDSCVLLRDQERWLPRLSRYEFLARDKSVISSLLANKTFIVTGGTGQLGQALCELLLQQYQCKLILVGRLHSSRIHQNTSFNVFEKAGRLQWVEIDGDNTQVLPQALDAALLNWRVKAPAGVFHLAGCMPRAQMAEANIVVLSEASFAKVTLGRALAKWLERVAPQAIFVQYSSLNAFFGGQDAGAYCWANALQSELTEQLNIEGVVRSWSLHWSLWEGMGISAHMPEHEIAMAHNQGYLSLQRDDAHRLLMAFLTQPPGNYYIGIDGENPGMSPYLRDERSDTRWVTECIGESGSSAIHFSQLLSQVRRCVPGYQARLGQPMMAFKTLSSPFPRSHNAKIDRHSLVDQVSNHFALAGQTPRNANEVKMLHLWNECLPRRMQFIDDNFFDRGGHSISAARLIARINQAFDVQWPVSVLFQRPTVRELAANLGGLPVQQVSPVLLPAVKALLSTSTARSGPTIGKNSPSNIVWMPTLLGDTSVYRELISNFTDVSHSWIESIDFPPFTDLNEYARHYHKQFIATQCIQQPLTLVGWSFGGVAAFTLAQLLHASGIQIASVILMDSAIGDAVPFGLLDQSILRTLFLAEVISDATQVAHLLSSSESNADWLAQLKSVLDQSAESPSLPALTVLFQRFCDRLSALNSYRPKPWLPEHFPVVYLKCKGNKLGTDTMGWHDLFTQFDVQILDVDHHQILHEENVKKLLKVIQQNQLHRVGKGEIHEYQN